MDEKRIEALETQAGAEGAQVRPRPAPAAGPRCGRRHRLALGDVRPSMVSLLSPACEVRGDSIWGPPVACCRAAILTEPDSHGARVIAAQAGAPTFGDAFRRLADQEELDFDSLFARWLNVPKGLDTR